MSWRSGSPRTNFPVGERRHSTQRDSASRAENGGYALLCLAAGVRWAPLGAMRTRLLPIALLALAAKAGAQLPPGFEAAPIAATWDQPVGLTFAEDGRMLVWEKAGRVWTVENGVKAAAPLLDLSAEVGDWRDYGLIGFALDPQFLVNGFVYAAYVVDWHHLEFFGTPQYSALADAYFRDTIARVVRYRANAADGFASIDPASRVVLLGEAKSTGVPICHQSHGVGTLLFGYDGSLLLSTGDGASYLEADFGQVVAGSSNTALAEGILQPKEAVGAWRSQLVDSLSGKLLRIDPSNGDGLPDNPFFDPLAPRAPRSRVWALGLRNPFRIALLPLEHGGHGGADPGVIVVGDVGWNAREELSTCDHPGQNFGWPQFEGLLARPEYALAGALNLDAPNPLAGAGCAAHLSFHDLLVQQSLAAPSWPNPCDAQQQLPASLQRFEHVRPWLEYGHGGAANTATYNGVVASVTPIDAPGAPLQGQAFDGDCVGALAWCASPSYPAPWRDTLFVADFVQGWLKSVEFDANHAPSVLRPFGAGAGAIVALAAHPVSRELYFIDYGSSGQAAVRHLRWIADSAPIAVASPAQSYGPSPLSVSFSSAGSIDPEGQPLTYSWDFDDGATSTQANPVHVFSGSGPQRFDVTLTVTDPSGGAHVARVLVSTDNTPPQVVITSPLDGASYPITAGNQVIALQAQVSDAEHGPLELDCAWRTSLFHNAHSHPEPVDTACSTSSVITPVGCDGEVYWYEIELVVTDAAGLSTRAVSRLTPDCCQGGPPTQSYCTAKVSALGCVPAVGSSGTPSVSSGAPFLVTCANVPSQRSGVLIYSFGAADWPFLGGRRCVASPSRRTPPRQSGGSLTPACDGAFEFDFNAWRTAGADPNLLVGRLVYAQYWFRDSSASFGAGLSDGLQFSLCP